MVWRYDDAGGNRERCLAPNGSIILSQKHHENRVISYHLITARLGFAHAKTTIVFYDQLQYVFDDIPNHDLKSGGNGLGLNRFERTHLLHVSVTKAND